MINKFLDYQALDAQLLKLERELENNENKKQVNLMARFVKDATEKSKQLNEEAAKLVIELEKMEEIEGKGIAHVEKLASQEIGTLSEEELKELDQKISKATHNLKELEKRLHTHADKIKNVLSEFEITRKKVFIARQKYKDNKDVYDKFVESTQPQIQKLSQQLKQKQKELDKDLLKKYEDLRKDGIFPIIVRFNNNTCGGCSTQLPSDTLDKIKEKGHIRCENCRRIIYAD